MKRLLQEVKRFDVKKCKDCGAPDPKWVSANIDVFICLKCCDVHKSLGTHISKAGMVEYIGVLKVKVIKGTDLAIRDIRTSDSYVVLALGHQRVFDYDTFSTDGIIGEVEVDLQPMITSVMAFGDAELLVDMQIEKLLKSEDNALVDDNTINIINGKVRQDVSLKLQNVES